MTRATCASSPFMLGAPSNNQGGEGAPNPGARRESNTASRAVQLSGGNREEREEGEEEDEMAVRGWPGFEVSIFQSLHSLWQLVDLTVGQNVIDIRH